MTAIPLNSSFIGVAKILAEATPVIRKNIKAIKPILRAAQKSVKFAEQIASVGESQNLNLFMNALNTGLTTFLILKQEEIQQYDIETRIAQDSGIAKAFQTGVNNRHLRKCSKPLCG